MASTTVPTQLYLSSYGATTFTKTEMERVVLGVFPLFAVVSARVQIPPSGVAVKVFLSLLRVHPPPTFQLWAPFEAGVMSLAVGVELPRRTTRSGFTGADLADDSAPTAETDTTFTVKV